MADHGVWILDYVVPPAAVGQENAFLYLFQGERYSLEELAKNARRDARKALRELEIGWITHDQLLTHGLRAFVDCRSRVGLSDGTRQHFLERFGTLREVAGYHFLGAWKGAELAAFMTLQAVEEWAFIAAYSDSAYRSSCPNDGLIHFALQHCVNERGIKVVSYGLSSVQEQSNAASLHEFKLKVGFLAIPVHRTFRVHRFLSPVVSRGTLRVFHTILKVLPKNRPLKKASGTLAQLLLDQQEDKH